MTTVTDRGPQSRINWQAAKAYYLALPVERRTLQAVADRFRCSRSLVSQIAKRDEWRVKAVEVDERVERKALTLLVRNRAERLARTLDLYDRAADLALGQLEVAKDGTVSLKSGEMPRIDQLLEKLPGLFKMAELAAGEATDRIEISQVQPVLAAFAKIAIIQTPKAERGETLRLLEEASGGLLQLGPGGAA